MFKFLWTILPSDYRWEVALKYVTLTVAKTFIAWVAGTSIGKHVSPAHWEVASGITTTALAGALKFVHDWAKLKYADTKLGKYL